MTTQQKIIKNKVGVLELAQHLGNVSKTCKVMGFPGTASTGSRNSTSREESLPCKRFPEGSPW